MYWREAFLKTFGKFEDGTELLVFKNVVVKRGSLCEHKSVSDHVLYFPKHLRSQNESGRCKKDTGNPEDFMQSSLNG
ncbi:hypothetical protein WN51_00115 [Melipona quadrifasciata]|uniref:Uncharacterized protein n=1 Tax=Melipona quadrifasciata TaxID=166423 RepID=A0A0M9ABL6_9HYME|nr:hypothetical protein WN51_00115 [Melipona quadrifasciata]